MNDDIETRMLRGPTIEYENEHEANVDHEYQRYQNSLDYGTSSSSSSSSSTSAASSINNDGSVSAKPPQDDISSAHRRGKAPSSGPKAVLADKAYADKLAIMENDRQKYQKQYFYQTLGNGHTLLNLDNNDPDNQTSIQFSSVSLASEQQRYQEQRQLRERHHATNSDDDEEINFNNSSRPNHPQGNTSQPQTKDTKDTVPTNNKEKEDDDDDLFLDDAFLANYRNQRIAQLREQSFMYHTHYGSVTEINDKDDLPTIIDTTNPYIYVLCLLYETYITSCIPWRKAWKELAINYPTQVRFICMRTSVASTAWDPISLPALAVYKNKITVKSIVRLQNNEEADGIGSGLGINPDTFDIEQWLIKKGWLLQRESSTIYNNNNTTSSNTSSVPLIHQNRLSIINNNDSEDENESEE